jgi:hypothetical protein
MAINAQRATRVAQRARAPCSKHLYAQQLSIPKRQRLGYAGRARKQDIDKAGAKYFRRSSMRLSDAELREQDFLKQARQPQTVIDTKVRETIAREKRIGGILNPHTT